MTQADLPKEFQAYGKNLSDGTLSFPHCQACNRFHWYPMKCCPHCGSADWQFAPVAGRGTLFSWTEVHRAFSPDFAEALPYVVGLVEFEDAPGVRLVTNIVDCPADSLQIGMALAPRFRKDGDKDAMVFFGPPTTRKI